MCAMYQINIFLKATHTYIIFFAQAMLATQQMKVAIAICANNNKIGCSHCIAGNIFTLLTYNLFDYQFLHLTFL